MEATFLDTDTNISPEIKNIYRQMYRMKPYNDKGEYNCKDTGPGVYMIHKKTVTSFPHVTVYVGQSGSNLQKTLYRHFQTWNDDRPQGRVDRIVYSKDNILISWMPVSSQEEALKIERLLIDALNPIDNTDYKQLTAAAAFIGHEEEQQSGGGWTPIDLDIEF